MPPVPQHGLRLQGRRLRGIGVGRRVSRRRREALAPGRTFAVNTERAGPSGGLGPDGKPSDYIEESRPVSTCADEVPAQASPPSVRSLKSDRKASAGGAEAGRRLWLLFGAAWVVCLGWFAFLVWGGIKEDPDIAVRTAIEAFHRAWNDEDFLRAHELAHPDVADKFRDEAFLDILRGIRAEKGAVLSNALLHPVYYDTDEGVIIERISATLYETNEYMYETFVYRIEEDTALLLAYWISDFPQSMVDIDGEEEADE